ncbi:MAG TPA: ABC transporter permease subunit, partial [Ignavibacteriaceae bacterium]|nr:ABC transporter permease subunit [Ignavibacteriaceae bacterium]
QMVLCQPIDRKSLFIGLYLGNSIPLAAGFLFGTLIGFILNGYANFSFENFILLLIVGAALTFIFTSISFLIGIKFSDKSRGLGFAIIIWLLLSVAYDGIVLFVIYYFRDYPIENIVLAISLLNPIDLGRIMFILNFDISALMGYTGALFHKFFGSALGIIISFSLLFLWLIIPTFWGLKSFKKKDF